MPNIAETARKPRLNFMDVKAGFFYFFSLVLLFAAFRVITARNPVHAVLYLVTAVD